MVKNIISTLFVSTLLFVGCSESQEWAAKPTPITTQWGEGVTVENAWREYPRPMLVRGEWSSLNGLWEYQLTAEGVTAPSDTWSGKILVPYPIQSALSGVAIKPKAGDLLWYKREFEVSKSWRGKNIILNFEAVDFDSKIWVNGNEVGVHQGSYNAFSFDITKYLKPNAKNELVVRVSDDTDITSRSVGKQNRSKNDYEDLTGIWQSVWLEPVDKRAYVEDLKINTTLEQISLVAEVKGDVAGTEVEYIVKDGGKVVVKANAKAGERVDLKILNPKLWSPDAPFLYDVTAELKMSGKSVDFVESYCGMRTIEYDDSQKQAQILLNGEPIFQMGPLDQNYWPESGLTPPSSEALLWEVKYLRSIGCNMSRLHIKRNPRIYYTHCDREGLLVWQDFICGRDKNPSAENSNFWVEEQETMMEQLSAHPSIVMWIVFNESWGEHNPVNIFNRVEAQDSSRIFSIASGWNDVKGVGDVRDMHDYTFFPSVVVGDNRAVVLGEGGGFASAVKGHNWKNRANPEGEMTNPLFGGFPPSTPRDDEDTHDVFRPTFNYGAPFTKQYTRFVDNLYLLKASGLVGVVYTQLTDMIDEENGWLTFDRKVSKVDPETTKAAHQKLYGAAPKPTVIYPASINGKAQEWKYSVLPMPAKDKKLVDAMNLQKGVDFGSIKWGVAKAPFTYGVNGGDIKGWSGDKRLVVKRDITLRQIPELLSVRVYSQIPGKTVETIQHEWLYSRIYINGKFVMDEVTRHEGDELKMSEISLNRAAKEALIEGKNSIAIEITPGVDRGKIKRGPDRLLMDFELVSWEL